MGCYSVHCAVTGLPIYSEAVVRIDISEGRFKSSGEQPWQPTSFPMYGECDTYGGLEGQESESDFLLIHKEAWDNIDVLLMPKEYSGDYKVDLFSLIDLIHDNFKEAKRYQGLFDSNSPDHKLSDDDIFWRALEKTPNHSMSSVNGNYFLIKKLLFSAEQCIKCSDPENPAALLYERSSLAELIVQKIKNRTYTEDDDKELQKISLLWINYSRMTGKYFMPVMRSPYCEQYADKNTMNQRKKFFAFCKKLASSIKT